MAGESVLIMDSTGRIVWANRRAYLNVGLVSTGLVGKNYLEFCPPDTHAALLDIHRRKLAGETVTFRLDLGRPYSITSGPVTVGGDLFLFAVARAAKGAPKGDEAVLGMLAAAEAAGGATQRLDLTACLVGALKDEARRLKGRVTLDLGSTPPRSGRPWLVRMALRVLLSTAAGPKGRIGVATGSTGRRSWIRVDAPRRFDPSNAALGPCRRLLRKEGALLTCRGTTLRLSL